MNLRATGTPLAFIAALTCNKWALERLFAPDEDLSSVAVMAMIGLLQMALALAGVAFHRGKVPSRIAPLLCVIVTGATITGVIGTWRTLTTEKQAEERSLLAMVDRVEALYLEQSTRLAKTLGASAANLGVPDHHSMDLFADEILVNVLDGSFTTFEMGVVEKREWGVATKAKATPRADLSIWEPLWARLDYLDWGKFFVHMGRFRDSTENQWDVQMRFSGAGIDSSGTRVGIRGEAAVTFDRMGDKWRISEWITRSLETQHTQGLFFSDVLDDIIPDPVTRHRARTTRHDSLVVAALSDSLFQAPHPLFTIQAFDRNPGLSVVDVNSDGRDDLYIMERWGPNQLLIHQPDGTFRDEAREYGLDFSDHSSCAIFADFDNDDDPDLFLGRTLAPTLYLENVSGRFIDRSSSHISGNLPSLAASIACADYDGDGLLDVYISTYFAKAIEQHTGFSGKGLDALRPHLSQVTIAGIQRRVDDGEYHAFLNRTGPPNVLLHNEGSGRFSVAQAPELDIWLNTYQSTWGDHDGDGDPDLYVANDFGLNNLILNTGNGHFEDITARSATADIGFGMGASWGDYDGDGDGDLYVANMFSKAGQRITSLIPGLDPTIAAMAGGNSLYRNDETRFEKVSGSAPPALEVEWGGWSWGGQFCDLDRDGCLDIHTLAGFYTAPPEVGIPIDT